MRKILCAYAALGLCLTLCGCQEAAGPGTPAEAPWGLAPAKFEVQSFLDEGSSAAEGDAQPNTNAFDRIVDNPFVAVARHREPAGFTSHARFHLVGRGGRVRDDPSRFGTQGKRDAGGRG